MEKSKHLQDQLRELKTEIDILKVEENDTEIDRLHEDGIQRGDSKYSTLRQVNILKHVLYNISVP
jgi:merlin protein